MKVDSYTCNGVRVPAGAVRARIIKRLTSLRARAGATSETARAPLLTKAVELQKELDRLKEFADDAMVGRAGCGADLTEQIQAIPDDGDVYTYTCPKCGNTGTVRKTPAPEEEKADVVATS